MNKLRTIAKLVNGVSIACAVIAVGIIAYDVKRLYEINKKAGAAK